MIPHEVAERPGVPGTAPASRRVKVLAWAVAAWCVGFAVVNVVFEITGRFSDGPYAALAGGLAVMSWLVVALKLLGAGTAVLTVSRRPAWVSVGVRTVLVWGAFALLALYSAGNLVKLGELMLTDLGRIDLRWLGYVGFFLAGAAGYGALAVSFARRARARKAHMVLGVLGAPLLLAGLLLAAPAVLSAMGLLPGV
jgi:hypothetical protein